MGGLRDGTRSGERTSGFPGSPGAPGEPGEPDAPGGGEASRAGDDLLAGLNEPQREAVLHGDGPLLILAGAGSGKTRVITRRIAWLIRERGVRPGEVLAITFTNKAAGEMRSRVEDLVPVQGAWLATFHSACARLLRHDIGLLEGYDRDFSIYDTQDRNQLLKQILGELGRDATRFRPAAVGQWISDRKNEAGAIPGADPTYVDDEFPGYEEEVLEKAFARYQEAMRRANALDFDDLLLKVLELFHRHPGCRDAWARRFRHVLVDEYQDTNRVQYLLMRHLASFHGNLAACGDPDQSIYAWRGADVSNILDFEQDFPGAHVVRLEQNYRSTRRILAAAQAVIAHNELRVEKALWSEGEEGERLVVLDCGDEEEEAREIALQILDRQRAGVDLRDVAIFYRANFMQRALERALSLHRLPYQIVAGVEFYERREIRDLVSYLKLLVNPADDVACRRVVNVPPRGVGDTSLGRLLEFGQERGLALVQAAASAEARAALRGRALRGVEAFVELLVRLKPLADGPAAVALTGVIDALGYLDWLRGLEDGSGEDRVENVEELLVHAEAYDRLEPQAGLRGFLQDIALVSETDEWDESASRVSLMTLHAAKGLEFPVVFVAGCEEELLPHQRAIDEGGAAAVEEERRLFYVGMTRAKERLFLTHARTRLHFGQTAWHEPSRFLDELPPDLIEGHDAGAEEADLLGEYAPAAGDPAAGLREGGRVLHDHFGAGVVVRLAGSGVNARATVRFEGCGEKQLLLQYAKLVPVEAGGGGR